MRGCGTGPSLIRPFPMAPVQRTLLVPYLRHLPRERHCPSAPVKKAAKGSSLTPLP